MTDDATNDVRTMWSEEQLDRALHTLRADVSTAEPAAARARAQLLRQIGEPAMVTTATTPVQPPAARPRHSARRWLAAAAVVGVIAAGALVVQTLQPSGATAQAADVLSRSASAASAATDPAVGPEQYLYVETHSWYSSTSVLPDGAPLTYLLEQIWQEWIPADRDQEWQQTRTVTGNRIWIEGSDEQAAAAGLTLEEVGTEVVRAPRGWYFEGSEQIGGWQLPTPEFMAGLPRDPEALYERLAADAPDNSHGDAEHLVYAADMLRSGQVPADLRAALYEALTRLPGLAVTDDAANLDGRLGIALGVTEPSGYRQEIIVDPRSGAFIGERQVDPDGVVQGFTAVTYGVADEIGVPPAG